LANKEIVNSLQESKNEITNEMISQIRNNYLMPLASRIENLVKIIEVYIKNSGQIGEAYRVATRGGKQAAANAAYNSLKTDINIQNFYTQVVQQYYQLRKDITGETIEDIVYVELKTPDKTTTVWKEVQGISLEKLLSVGKVNFNKYGNVNINITNAQVRSLMYTKTKRKKKNITISSADYKDIFRGSKSIIKRVNKELAAKKNTEYQGKIVPYLSNGTVAETIKRLQEENKGRSFYNLTQQDWENELKITSLNMKSGALGGDVGNKQIKAASTSGSPFHIGGLDELARKLRNFHDQVLKLSTVDELKKVVSIFFTNNFEKAKNKNAEVIDKEVLNNIDKTVMNLLKKSKNLTK
jgi:hypothetical protein